MTYIALAFALGIALGRWSRRVPKLTRLPSAAFYNRIQQERPYMAAWSAEAARRAAARKQ